MRKYRKQFLLILLTAGFLCGILIVNLCGETYFRSEGILTEEIWERIGEETIDETGFFRFLLVRRLGIYLLFLLLGYTAAGIPVLSVYAVWLGCAAGILLTLSFVRLGIRGLLLTAACLLPQDFFYGIAFYNLYQSLWGRRSPQSQSDTGPQKGECAGFGLILLRNLPVLLAGILLECYVNPAWIRWISGW